MKIIAGLGNPGKKYRNTRHNIGFMFLDKLQENWNFPNFKIDKKFNSKISKGLLQIKDSKFEILLVKPQTFMNNSGAAVKKIIDFYKIKPTNLIVVHDDLDIKMGKFKIATDSRAAGHNGVQNIIDTLGTQKFKRIRIGIEGEEKRKSRLISGHEFVLQKFSAIELKFIQTIFSEIIFSIQNLL